MLQPALQHLQHRLPHLCSRAGQATAPTGQQGVRVKEAGGGGAGVGAAGRGTWHTGARQGTIRGSPNQSKAGTARCAMRAGPGQAIKQAYEAQEQATRGHE